METSLFERINGTAAKRTKHEVDALLRDARPWLYRLAFAITASHDAAEDAAQEAIIRANRSKQALMAVDEPRAWLRTIVVRCAITALSNTQAPPISDQAIETDPVESLAVRQTLARLRPDDRTILALAHFEALSYAEIADALEIPVGTVASRLHAAREAFRKEWNK